MGLKILPSDMRFYYRTDDENRKHVQSDEPYFLLGIYSHMVTLTFHSLCFHGFRTRPNSAKWSCCDSVDGWNVDAGWWIHNFFLSFSLLLPSPSLSLSLSLSLPFLSFSISLSSSPLSQSDHFLLLFSGVPMESACPRRVNVRAMGSSARYLN